MEIPPRLMMSGKLSSHNAFDELTKLLLMVELTKE